MKATIAERNNANVFEQIYKSNHFVSGIDVGDAEIASTLLIDLSLVSDTEMSIIRYFENDRTSFDGRKDDTLNKKSSPACNKYFGRTYCRSS